MEKEIALQKRIILPRWRCRSGQYNTIYGILIMALSFVVMLGIFSFSDNIKNTAVKNLGNLILDEISDKILAALVDMKSIVDRTTTENLTIIITVPKRVGEQNYVVKGEGNKFTIRTIGRKSLISETNVTNIWENISIFGSAFSQSGKIQIDYIKPNTTLLS